MAKKYWLLLAALTLSAACGSTYVMQHRASNFPFGDPAITSKKTVPGPVPRNPEAGPSAFKAITFDPLPYDGKKTRHLEVIQKSELTLQPDELGVLSKHGFVMTERAGFPSFAHGYAAIYKNDLPVYVSADSLLEAVHRSYDAMLKQYEREVIVAEFGRLLADMRQRLAAQAAHEFGADVERDVDVYLAVPLALLTGTAPSPVRGADRTTIGRLTAGALAANGTGTQTLFGRPQEIDFSQFKPRGHYEGDAALERYFRAAMWFGRIDARIVDVDEQGKLELSRRAVAGMLAQRVLLDDASLKRWRGLDRALATFVGERDNMSFAELEQLLKDLKVRTSTEALALPDEKWVQALNAGNYGYQRIASHLRTNSEGKETLPNPRSFSPFGQRFVVDSEVLSKLVYDRLLVQGRPQRLMPSPLDVAYAAFGNTQAKDLLKQEIQTYGYESALDEARTEVERAPKEFWRANLYNLWLDALRTLSPGQTPADGLPSVARTEAWGLRILNTQLASWAELRHNTILYAKQSYTAGILCEFPDAYVDPYPEFYGHLESFAQGGQQLVAIAVDAGKRALGERIKDYFQHLAMVSGTLKGMAERQRRAEPWTSEQMKFINQTVRITREPGGCGGGPAVLSGWYAGLFYDADDALKFDPTIADVHTQPTDEAGNPVGRILHVGTGLPRLMVVTADTCKGPSAYVGLAFSYYEEVTSGFKRMTDHEWEGVVHTKKSPQWIRRALIARSAP